MVHSFQKNMKNLIYTTVLFTLSLSVFGQEYASSAEHKNHTFNTSLSSTELLSFVGVAQTSTVQLNWVATSQKNTDIFTVERAGNDMQFKTIGSVKENISAEGFYSFTDVDPLEDQAFYRLKVTDLDGSATYHKTISVFFEAANSNMTITSDSGTLRKMKLETSDVSAEEVRLLDLNGQLIYSQAAQFGVNEIRIPENIKAGTYLCIVLGSQGKQHQQKILIL